MFGRPAAHFSDQHQITATRDLSPALRRAQGVATPPPTVDMCRRFTTLFRDLRLAVCGALGAAALVLGACASDTDTLSNAEASAVDSLLTAWREPARAHGVAAARDSVKTLALRAIPLQKLRTESPASIASTIARVARSLNAIGGIASAECRAHIRERRRDLVAQLEDSSVLGKMWPGILERRIDEKAEAACGGLLSGDDAAVADGIVRWSASAFGVLEDRMRARIPGLMAYQQSCFRGSEMLEDCRYRGPVLGWAEYLVLRDFLRAAESFPASGVVDMRPLQSMVRAATHYRSRLATSGRVSARVREELAAVDYLEGQRELWRRNAALNEADMERKRRRSNSERRQELLHACVSSGLDSPEGCARATIP